MKQRVISAVIMLIIVIACMVVSPYTRILLFTFAGVYSVKEMKNVFGLMDVKCVDWALYLYVLGNAALCAFSVTTEIKAVYYFAWAFLAMFLIMFAGIMAEPVRGHGAMSTLGILVYPLLPYALVTHISIDVGWIAVFVTACLATWICDSFALFGGKAFGKHKAALYVSPNKTVEGCVCGAISSLFAGVISYFVIPLLGAEPIPLVTCTAVSLIASSFGQVGDLAASLLKRMVGIKDYSNLIPGHGGMMDRADSLLFSIPVTWFCFFVANVI